MFGHFESQEIIGVLLHQDKRVVGVATINDFGTRCRKVNLDLQGREIDEVSLGDDFASNSVANSCNGGIGRGGVNTPVRHLHGFGRCYQNAVALRNHFGCVANRQIEFDGFIPDLVHDI